MRFRRRLRSVRAQLAVVVGVGTLLRVVFVAWAARPLRFPWGADPLTYATHAENLAHGRGYIVPYTGKATAFQPPGWSMALGAWYWVVNHTPLPDDEWKMAGVVAIVVAIASMLLLFSIGRHLFDERVGVLAAAVYALWPNLIFYTGVPALELFFILTVLVVIWLPLHFGWPRVERLPFPVLAVTGVATGVMLLVRPFGGVSIVAMLIAGVLAGRGWRVTGREVGTIALCAFAVLVPWTVRNAVKLHGFVPIATNLGETFCIGHQPRANGGFLDNTRYCIDDKPTGQPHDEVVVNSYATNQGLKFFRQHPLHEARLVFWRAYYLLREDHGGLDAVESGGKHRFIQHQRRQLMVTAADAYFFGAVVLALFSVRRFFVRARADLLLVALTGLGLLLIPLELYGLPRFNVPLAPFTALGAAVTLARLVAAPAVPGTGRARTPT